MKRIVEGVCSIYIYHVLLVDREEFASLIVCSPMATICLVLNALGQKVLILMPIAHQRHPTSLLLQAPLWTELRNENMSI